MAAMANDDELRQELLDRIKARRATITTFVRNLERRGVRLTNLSIICSAVTTALTAGPALGGERFTAGMQGLFQLSSGAPVWRVLCLGAVILSIVAAVSTTMYKSHDMAARLTKAQACNANLGGLETAVAFQQVGINDGVKLFQQYLAEVAFIPEQPVVAQGRLPSTVP